MFGFLSSPCPTCTSPDQKERLATLKLEEQRKTEEEQSRCQRCCDNLLCCEIGGEGLCCLGTCCS